MKKIKKVTVSAISILFSIYNSCSAADVLQGGRTAPLEAIEPVGPKYFRALFITIGIICLVGAIFLCIGLGMKNNRKKKILRCSSTTKGKVIDIVKRLYEEVGTGIDAISTYLYHPKIEYSVNNQKYIKISNFGTKPSKYEIGQEVEIHYNPNKCDMYYIEGDNTQKKLETIFTIAGGIILIMAVLIGIIGTVIINNYVEC